MGKPPVQHRFLVDKKSVFQRSPYLQTLPANLDIASDEYIKAIELANDDSDVFAVWLRCVNDGSIHREDNDRDLDKAHFHRPAKVYILADILQDLRSANTIMDSLLRTQQLFPTSSLFGTCPGGPSAASVRLVYTKAPVGSPLRKLVRDSFVNDTLSLEKVTTGLPQAFWLDLVREIKCLIGPGLSSAPHLREQCFYHQHNADCPPCPGSVPLPENRFMFGNPANPFGDPTNLFAGFGKKV